MEQGALDLGDTAKRKWLIDLSDLRGELAKRHGVRISKDDPALYLVTAFEIVARKMAVDFEAASQRSNDDMSGLMAQHVETAKGIAVEVVDAALVYQTQKMNETIDKLAPAVVEQAKVLLHGLAGEIVAAREAVQAAERRAWSAATVAGGCLVLTVGLLVGHFI